MRLGAGGRGVGAAWCPPAACPTVPCARWQARCRPGPRHALPAWLRAAFLVLYLEKRKGGARRCALPTPTAEGTIGPPARLPLLVGGFDGSHAVCAWSHDARLDQWVPAGGPPLGNAGLARAEVDDRRCVTSGGRRSRKTATSQPPMGVAVSILGVKRIERGGGGVSRGKKEREGGGWGRRNADWQVQLRVDGRPR